MRDLRVPILRQHGTVRYCENMHIEGRGFVAVRSLPKPKIHRFATLVETRGAF